MNANLEDGRFFLATDDNFDIDSRNISTDVYRNSRWTPAAVSVLHRRDRRRAPREAGRRAQGRQLRSTVDIIRWWLACAWTCPRTRERCRNHRWLGPCCNDNDNIQSRVPLFARYLKQPMPRYQVRGEGEGPHGAYTGRGGTVREVWERRETQGGRRGRGRAKRGSPRGPLKITSYTLFQTDHLR